MMLRSLRARLLAICVLIGCVSVIVAGLALTLTVRSWIYEDAQEQALTAFRHEMDIVDDYSFALTSDFIPADGPGGVLGGLTLPHELRGRPVAPGAVVVDGKTVQSRAGEAEMMAPELRADLEQTRSLYRFQRLPGDRVVMGHSLPERAVPQGNRTAVVYVVEPLNGVPQRLQQMTVLIAVVTLGAAALSVLAGLVASRLISRPLTRVKAISERVIAGEADARLPDTSVTELRGLTAAFNGMLDQQRQAVEVLRGQEEQARRFASDVSHELRSPLAALVPAAEVLREEVTPLGGHAALAAALIEREIEGLVATVNDLLEITQLDSGTASVISTEIELSQLVESALASRGWADVPITGATDLTLHSDHRRITAVVTNLVGNALKHGAMPVSVNLQPAPNGATIEVSDQGDGVPESEAQKIFERLHKADHARTRTGGAGLGLAIARDNARLLGGDVTYRRENQSTHFHATFPDMLDSGSHHHSSP